MRLRLVLKPPQGCSPSAPEICPRRSRPAPRGGRIRSGPPGRRCGGFANPHGCRSRRGRAAGAERDPAHRRQDRRGRQDPHRTHHSARGGDRGPHGSCNRFPGRPRRLDGQPTSTPRAASAAELVRVRAEALAETIKTSSAEASKTLGELATTTTASIRASASDLERTVTTLSSGTTSVLKQNAAEVEKALLGRQHRSGPHLHRQGRRDHHLDPTTFVGADASAGREEQRPHQCHLNQGRAVLRRDRAGRGGRGQGDRHQGVRLRPVDDGQQQ